MISARFQLADRQPPDDLVVEFDVRMIPRVGELLVVHDLFGDDEDAKLVCEVAQVR